MLTVSHLAAKNCRKTNEMYRIYTKKMCWLNRHVLRLVLIMKLTTVLMIATFLHVSAGTYAQRVTLSKQDISIEQVFQEIKKQTGYNVVYSDRQVNDQKKLNVRFKNTALNEVMEYCLKNQSLVFDIEEKTIVIKKEEKGFFDKLIDKFKTFDAYGTVFDEDGNVLPGTTVKVKGSARSMVTGTDGVFSFSGMAETDILVFTYVGHKQQEVTLSGKRMPLKVIMISSKSELQEVNVSYNTGYQTIPKERATGSFGFISAQEIGKRVASSLMERIEGTVSGLLVNVGSPDRSLTNNRDNFTIRGVSTIYSEKKPLIVIDGFPTELDLVNINPDNVQNITILKDAAAASIWGMRAANGVIVIESKKGNYSDKPRVNFSSIFTLTGKPRLDYVPIMNSAQYMDIERELVDKKILPATSSGIPGFPPNNSTGVDLYLQFTKGLITKAEYDAKAQLLSQVDVNQQKQKYLLQSPFSQQYDVSISGGSNVTRNYLSASYTDEYTNNQGVYDNRFVVNFSNETKITPKLTFSAETFITHLQQHNNGVPGGGPNLLPYDQIVDAAGRPINFSVVASAASLDQLAAKGYLPWKYNFIDELANSDNTFRSLAYRLTGGLNYKIKSWITADLKYMTEKSYSKTRNYFNPSTYSARNLINTYTPQTTVVKSAVPSGGILDIQDAEQNNYTTRGQLNFNPDFHNFGRLDAVVGAELRQTLSSGNGSFLYGYDDRLLTSSPVDYKNAYPTVSGQNMQLPYSSFVNNRKDRYASIFGNLNYTYSAKYSLSGSFRKDYSNLFGAPGVSTAVPLWSLGGMWRAKDEVFMSEFSWLTKLNLRATVGYNGNLNKDASPYLIIQSSRNPNIYNKDPFSSISSPANPQLRWERVKTYNLGTDFSLFNSRINGTVDAYWRKSLDLLGSVDDINPTYGFTTLFANKLEMTSRGVDIDLNAKIINTSDFSWTPSVNISYNTNKVTKAYFQQQTTQYYIYNMNPIVDKPIGSLYTYKFAGLDETGHAMIYNAKGIKERANNTAFDGKDLGSIAYQGVTVPPYFGGVSNTFTYKNFDLYALFTFKAGHKFLRPAPQSYLHEDMANRWRTSGDELKTSVPVIDPAAGLTLERYVYTDQFVENASYVRLRDVTLTYNIPVKQMTWNGFQNLYVSVTGRNLALWTANKEGIDPDYLNNLSSSLPPSKSFVFSIKATF